MSQNPDTTLILPDIAGGLHERLALAVEGLIADGRLRAGDRLPTHRELAKQAGVAIGTVTKAIEILSDRGIVRGEVGRGTFISESLVGRTEDGVIDLTINAPPPVIEEGTFLEASARAARASASMPNGGYVDLRGTIKQRATLAGWLARTRMPATSDELLVCVGAQHAIHLALADLKRVSRSIASEGATFSGTIVAASDLEMAMLPVDHDEEGMLPDQLDAVLKGSGCRIVYTTPVCQNPLGFESGEQRRRDILAVCQRRDAFIVEDDIYALYSAKDAPTYKELDPDRVYYLTSLSKCLTPLMRVGMLIPPQSRQSTISRAMRAGVWGAPPFAIELGCAMIDMGTDAVVGRILRSEAKSRIDLSKKILGLNSLLMPGGAPHFWLPMPAVEAEKLARRASERGVRLTPPDATSIGGEMSGGVRLCVMAPPRRDDLSRALRIVAELVDNPEETVV